MSALGGSGRAAKCGLLDGGVVFIISTRELLFRTGRADVSANGEWQRNAVGRHRTLLNRQSFCAGLFVGTRVLLLALLWQV